MVKSIRSAINLLISTIFWLVMCVVAPIVYAICGVVFILSLTAVTISIIVALYNVSLAYCITSLVIVSIFILCVASGGKGNE